MQNEGRLQYYPTCTPCSTFCNTASRNQIHCLVIPITNVFKLQRPIAVCPFKTHKQPRIRSFSHTGPTGQHKTTASGSELYVNFILFICVLRYCQSFLLPTDVQENYSERSVKIYITITTAPTCFAVITIIRERTV